MAGKYEDQLKALTAPFPAEDIEWRVAECKAAKGDKAWAKVLAYISARAVQDRLDAVMGIENWKSSYRFEKFQSEADGKPTFLFGTVATISLRFDGEWVDRDDGAEFTDFEPFKGGISGAFKRAGSVWGIGRYLYNLESGWATIVDQNTPGARFGQDKERNRFYWVPPTLPAWALPQTGTAAKPGIQEGAKTTAPPVTPKPNTEAKSPAKPDKETKASVGNEVLTLAGELRLSKDKLTEWMLEYTKAPSSKEVTLDQLKAFRDVLLREKAGPAEGGNRG